MTFWHLRKRFSPGMHIPRLASLALLVVYSVTAFVSFQATTRPESLGLRLGMCSGEACVAWVMPASHAWDMGARAGMNVLSVNGKPVTAENISKFDSAATSQHSATLQPANGDSKFLSLGTYPIGQYPMKLSLWLLGGLFAFLGAAVVLRRPDLSAARRFGMFGGVTGIALAIGPAAGGPAPPLALAVQFISMVGVGAMFLPFVLALITDSLGKSHHRLAVAFSALGIPILIVYAVAVSAAPWVYDAAASLVILYLSTSLLVGGVLLAVSGGRQKSSLRIQQTQIAVWGIAMSTLPLIGLTLAPRMVGQPEIVSAHWTILALALLPVSFAYAILRYQLMGIRRLVHRGMVYGVTSVVILTVVLSLTVVAVAALSDAAGGPLSSFAIAVIITAGVFVFVPMRTGARWLVDNVIYRDTVDYRTFLDVVPEELLSSDRIPEVSRATAYRLAQVMHLESVLLFLGPSPDTSRMVAATGPRAEEILEDQLPDLIPHIEASVDRGLLERRWESDSLLVTHLKWGNRYLGYILLGPKRDGEVFLEEEKVLVNAVTPILALALDKGQLSEELRELNLRLVNAEEAERARIAGDLHDGPLQKAILMSGGLASGTQDKEFIALQLVAEIREICSRLRPSMLDDLGLVSTLEWLLDGVSKQSGISTQFIVENLGEDERFAPSVELALFRLTQEATNNVMKHAKASDIHVTLSKQRDDITLMIRDNGIGFSIDKRGKGGFGMSEMRERAVQVDGRFSIDSIPGLGTTVTVTVFLGQTSDTEEQAFHPTKGPHEFEYQNPGR